MQTYQIEAISEGIAYGKAINVRNNFIIKDSLCSNTILEKQLFRKAVNQVIEDLVNLQSSEMYHDEEFINVHIMILNDPTLYTQVDELIETKRYYAEKAFDVVISKYIKQFEKADSFYLQERDLDFKDIRNRVLQHLNQNYFKDVEADKIIIVCDELYPSLLMEYKKNVAGVISRNGGPTSHGAILCKAREIPYILSDAVINDGENIVIDSRLKSLFVGATPEMMQKYHDLKKEIKHNKKIDDFSKYKIKVLANVSTNDDIEKVIEYNMYGVGLYRTEFIFMNLNRPLSYEDQLEIYGEAIDCLNGKCITFRTFDIGDDKQLPYLKASRKGIDNYKNNRDLFSDQVRAMMNANKYSNIRIMFPMIESIDEFKYLRDWTLKIKREELNDSYVKIGMMLETKQALEHLEDFKDIDFMSIGTNDLTSELYHLNRNELSHYDQYLDDLVINLQKVVEHCKRYNIELSICGEIAGVPEITSRLYEIGLRTFSISTSNAKSVNVALKKCLNFK